MTIPTGSSRYHDFRVIAKGPTGKYTRVFLDDEELRGVMCVDIKSDASGVNEITITFIAQTINDDGGLFALLTEGT